MCNLTEDSRLEVDAILGDDEAQRELQERRREAFALIEAEEG